MVNKEGFGFVLFSFAIFFGILAVSVFSFSVLADGVNNDNSYDMNNKLVVSATPTPTPNGSASGGGGGGGGGSCGSNGCVSVDETDKENPDTDILYVIKEDGSNRRDCEDGKIYTNYNDLVVHGVSSDSESGIVKVDYIRSGRDRHWKNAEWDDNPSLSENWYTDPDDAWEITEYRVCGRARDSEKNQENENLSVDEVEDDDCCNLCIDTYSPTQPGKPVLQNPSDCVENYINENPQFSWAGSDDNGCAGIKHYEIEVYYSNGSLKEQGISEDASYTIIGNNGEDYYIRVRAIDKADNPGEWSEYSDEIYVDTGKPDVEITSENSGWYDDDFYVSEEDGDAEGNLWKCYYKIKNNDEWTTPGGNSYELEALCNEDILIDVSEYCPDDGVCKVYKKVQDKACNADYDNKEFYVDTQPPVLEKEIGEPSYSDGVYVTTQTLITIDANDAGIGVRELCYSINEAEPVCINTTELEQGLNLTFNFEEESQHNLTFWATDQLDHEARESQMHYVDLTPPLTEKIYGLPLYTAEGVLNGISMLIKWISSQTSIILTAEDKQPHPSGVKETWWTLFIPNGEGEHVEWYGRLTEEWYEDIDECLAGNAGLMHHNNESEDGNETGNETEDSIVGENCIQTNWTNKYWYLDNPEVCKEWRYDDERGILWCVYWSQEENASIEENPVNVYQEGMHKICYLSIDKLGNKEEMKCQVFNVDNTPPEVMIINPSENAEIGYCSQTIKASVSDLGAGVKEVKAYLISEEDENETILRETTLDYYESTDKWIGVMDKSLPVGNYTIKVIATDNVGNEGRDERHESLVSALNIRSILPTQCSVDSQEGGNCVFTFNICMRGGNALKMWMDKLGGEGGIAPEEMNAVVSYGEDTAVVGESEEESELLMMGEGEVIVDSFDLNMQIPGDRLPIGSYGLDYWLGLYEADE